MKDQWLKDIHDRMTDFETEEPVGLWDDIAPCLDNNDNQTPPIPRPTRHSVFIWIKRASGIAAMLATALGTYMLLPDRTTDKPILSPYEYDQSVQETQSTSAGIHSVKTPLSLSDRQTDGKPDYSPTYQETKSEQHDETVWTKNTDTPVTTDTDSVPVITKENDDLQIVLPTRHNNNLAYTSPRIPNGKGRISISAYSSGSFNSITSNSDYTNTVVSATGPDGTRWEDGPMLGILLFNQGAKTEAEIKHHLPIRAGVSLSYDINDCISLQSGLTYTCLKSDLRFGSENHYITGSQTLHYIGIPLSIRWKALSWKRFDLYASAGMTGEKCVSGKTDRKYIINNQPEETSRENISIRPLQWSLNAAAGIQFNISSFTGLYIEPGVNYYIDNGSTVKTIYKDKPFNFNLNLGLRLTLND